MIEPADRIAPPEAPDATEAAAAPERPWRAPTLALLGDAQSLTAGTPKTSPGGDGSSHS